MARTAPVVIALALGAAAAAIVAFAQTSQTPSAGGTPPAPAAQAPAATAPEPATFPEPVKKKLHATTDVRGKEAPKLVVEKWLSAEPSTKDKLVLVDFWATWCGPCRRLMPELEAWQKEFKDDLVVVGLSDEPAATVEKFTKGKPHAYAMAIDTKAVMKKALGVQGIPHIIIIGTDNVVRWQGFPGAPEEKLTTATIQRIIAADKARRQAATAPATAPGATPPANP